MANTTLFVLLAVFLRQAAASFVGKHSSIFSTQKSWVPQPYKTKTFPKSISNGKYWHPKTKNVFSVTPRGNQGPFPNSIAYIGHLSRHAADIKFASPQNKLPCSTPAKFYRSEGVSLAMSTLPNVDFPAASDASMRESLPIHAHVTAQSAATAALKRSRSASLVDPLVTMGSLVLWYYFNVLYNIENKKALNLFPLPYTVATLQMYVGLPIFLIPWLLGWRKRPQLYQKSLKAYWPFISQAFWHSMVHVASVVALGAGAISFVHIVKAAEPAFTAVLSSSILGARMSILTYLCLFPIIFGVGLASLKELSFTWKALAGAMLSNVGSAMRGIEAKITMSDKSKIGKNITAANIYAIMTIFATIILSPLLLLDATKWIQVLNDGLIKGITSQMILKHIISSGLWYYLYNEIAFIALGRLNPVSHAVANTIKRVFLILTSVVVFGSRFTPLGAAGSSLAVFGTLLYSLSKQRFG